MPWLAINFLCDLRKTISLSEPQDAHVDSDEGKHL
jgi:hypothetical protein